jgi:glycosyltransferase involved in cell wall biosynthesis
MMALAQVRCKEKISVRIIGEGDFSYRLKEMIDSLQLKDMVEFDNRSYPVHAIVKLIEDCNIGIVPLEVSSVTNYALPLKLLEYISLGLPVVSVRNAAISYYLSEEDCLFFEPTDVQSLSRILDQLAENPDILLRYRERSVALRSRFSWHGEKLKYVALLRLLSGVPKRLPNGE